MEDATEHGQRHSTGQVGQSLLSWQRLCDGRLRQRNANGHAASDARELRQVVSRSRGGRSLVTGRGQERVAWQKSRLLVRSGCAVPRRRVARNRKRRQMTEHPGKTETMINWVRKKLGLCVHRWG